MHKIDQYKEGEKSRSLSPRAMHQAWLIKKVNDSVDVCVIHHLVSGSSISLKQTLQYQPKCRGSITLDDVQRPRDRFFKARR